MTQFDGRNGNGYQPLPSQSESSPPKSRGGEVLATRLSLQLNERAVLAHLAAAWNAYLELNKAHPDQDAEFRHGIHALQHQIMARPTRRMLQAETE